MGILSGIKAAKMAKKLKGVTKKKEVTPKAKTKKKEEPKKAKKKEEFKPKKLKKMKTYTKVGAAASANASTKKRPK